LSRGTGQTTIVQRQLHGWREFGQAPGRTVLGLRPGKSRVTTPQGLVYGGDNVGLSSR